jgi:hypothetical protein
MPTRHALMSMVHQCARTLLSDHIHEQNPSAFAATRPFRHDVVERVARASRAGSGRLMNAGTRRMPPQPPYQTAPSPRFESVGAHTAPASFQSTSDSRDPNMNRIIPSFIIAATTVFASAAFADDITPTPPFVSTRDRAEVQAELLQFRGQANPWSIAYNPLARFQSALTRDEVRAQFLASRDDVAAMTGRGQWVLRPGGGTHRRCERDRRKRPAASATVRDGIGSTPAGLIWAGSRASLLL